MADYSDAQLDKELAAKELDFEQFLDLLVDGVKAAKQALQEKGQLAESDEVEIEGGSDIPYKVIFKLNGFQGQTTEGYLQSVYKWLTNALKKASIYAGEKWFTIDPNIKESKDYIDVCGVQVAALMQSERSTLYADESGELKRETKEYKFLVDVRVGSDETNYVMQYEPDGTRWRETVSGTGQNFTDTGTDKQLVTLWVRPDDRYLNHMKSERPDLNERKAMYEILMSDYIGKDAG